MTAADDRLDAQRVKLTKAQARALHVLAKEVSKEKVGMLCENCERLTLDGVA